MRFKKIISKSLDAGVICTLIIALFAQSVINLSIGINYRLNKKYIAEHLCENRNKPCMHCNGKCYLRKQLKNENENDKIPSRYFSNEGPLMMNLPSEYSFVFHPPSPQNIYITTRKNIYFLNCYTDIFHPPKEV